MGLFSRKKKKEEKNQLGPLPEFPKFPSKEEFPSYKPRFADIKLLPIQETPTEKEELELPVRKPFLQKFSEFPEEPTIVEERPLFVKIDKYKEAIYTVDKIKVEIQEANKALDELSRIKEQEDRELELWRSNLDKIKEKLISIDKKLFRV